MARWLNIQIAELSLQLKKKFLALEKGKDFTHAKINIFMHINVSIYHTSFFRM